MVEVDVTDEELKVFRRLLNKGYDRKRLRKGMLSNTISGIMAAPLVFVVWFFIVEDSKYFYGSLIAVGVIVWLLFFGYLLERFCRSKDEKELLDKHFEKLCSNRVYNFSECGLIIDDKIEKATMYWQAFIGYSNANGLLILWVTKFSGICIPLRCIENRLEEINRLLSTYLNEIQT